MGHNYFMSEHSYKLLVNFLRALNMPVVKQIFLTPVPNILILLLGVQA